MNIHTLSYTRQVSRLIRENEETLSIFKGSSLTRKKHEKQGLKENQKKNFLRVRLETTEQAYVDLFTGEIIKPEDLQSASISRTVNDGALPGTDRKERTHRLSPRTKNKIREKIFALYKSAGASRFTFLTLTMINDCEDTKAQACLNKFLTVIRKLYGKFLYIWVAERQSENNGRIHFHFITDRRFPIKYLNSLWVMQQYRSGITHQRYDEKDIMFLHKCGSMQSAFNPVDIREVENIDALSGYLTGYITKNNEQFTCAAWHCCRGVSALFTGQVVGDAVVNEVRNKEINQCISKKGRLYVAKTTDVVCKKTGKLVATITNIVNKKHLSKHLNYVEELNKLVLSDYLTKQQVSQTFLLDRKKYFDAYYQKVTLN